MWKHDGKGWNVEEQKDVTSLMRMMMEDGGWWVKTGKQES